MVQRYVNQGFSGGEKKRNEMLQLAVLEPEIAILDETDSGLDIDALKVVAGGSGELVGPDLGVLLITHYQRILNYITADRVHVMMQGRIVRSGGPELAERARGEGLRGHPRGARHGRGSEEAEPVGAPDGTRRKREANEMAWPSGAWARSTSIASARTSRSSSGRSTASRSSTSTARPRRQKPRQVIDTVTEFYGAAQRERPPRRCTARPRRRPRCSRAPGRSSPAVHRRPDPSTIVFTRGTTESINLVAHGWGRQVPAGGRRDRPDRDGAPLEHRAVAARGAGHRRACFGTSRYTEDGSLDLADLESVAHRADEDRRGHGACRTCSGRSRRSKQLAEAAHAVGALVVVDGAQLVSHSRSTSSSSTSTS